MSTLRLEIEVLNDRPISPTDVKLLLDGEPIHMVQRLTLNVDATEKQCELGLTAYSPRKGVFSKDFDVDKARECLERIKSFSGVKLALIPLMMLFSGCHFCADEAVLIMALIPCLLQGPKSVWLWLGRVKRHRDLHKTEEKLLNPHEQHV